jgi:lipoprotein-releasing system permease protein
MRLALKIAARFLSASRGQTILIVLGIAIGVSVQIFIGSLIDGLQRSLVDKTIGSASHVTVVPAENEKDFEEPDDLIASLRDNESITAVSAVFDSSGFIKVDEETYPVLMRGVQFEDANAIYKFDNSLISGALPSDDKEVIIGKDLAETADIKTGDTVDFLTPQGGVAEVTVTGIYDLKVATINKSWLPATLKTAQTLFDKQAQLSSIETQVDEVFNADDMGAAIAADLPDELSVTNWKDQNEQLLSGLSGQSASSYMIQVFVLLAVLLGISSVLAISVVQKSRQIGILKAMGIKNATARAIFLLQGLILGVIGGIIGTGIGIGLSYAFSNFVKNPDGTPLVPFYLDTQFIALSVIIAILAATVASLIPARKSSKLNPIEVIRNG